LKTVTDAAALLPPAQRDDFLRSIAAVLDAEHEAKLRVYNHPTDRDVEKALAFVLARCVALGHSVASLSESRGPSHVTNVTSEVLRKLLLIRSKRDSHDPTHVAGILSTIYPGSIAELSR
jgi:hypothetical protein